MGMTIDRMLQPDYIKTIVRQVADKVIEARKPAPVEFLGFEVVVDETIPEGEMHLRRVRPDGTVEVHKITGLL